MKKEKGLLILHIDGLSFKALERALEKNYMPFTKKLLQNEEYEMLSYRCGIPSTTPFVQAGIIYGDNQEIPSFNWWDKQSGLNVHFGLQSSFGNVAHKYFSHTKSLAGYGACIGTCFPGKAKETFALAYRRRIADGSSKTMRRALLFHWIRNPFHIIDWLYNCSLVLLKLFIEVIFATFQGRKIPLKYLAGNLMNEFFLHHLTRYATMLAMKNNYPVIYAAFYAYDEVSHAFGPEDPFTEKTLFQVDKTIQYLTKRRTAEGYLPNKLLLFFGLKPRFTQREYEVIVLSDHGQIPTVNFKTKNGKQVHEIIGEFLPNYIITDKTGTTHKNNDRFDGHIFITYSGGLAHLYFTDISWRLKYKEIQKYFPKLLSNILTIKEIEGVMMKNEKGIVFLTKNKKFYITKKLTKETKQFLQKFDNPEILAKQLQFLNSFERAGDIILFGKYDKNTQINFEVQSGGHGGIGGEQMFPFILARKQWKIPDTSIESAVEMHKVLKIIREKLVSKR